MTQYAEPPAPESPAAPPLYPPPAYPAPDGAALKPGDPGYQWAIPQDVAPGIPAPKRRRRGGILGVGGAILTVVAIRLALGTGFDAAVGATRDPLYTPQQVGSATRMTSGEARDVENEMKADMASSQKAQAGVYGRNGRPQYALVAGYGDEDNAQQVIAGFADGADGMGPVRIMQDGIACATYAPEGVKGAVCAWGTGDDSDGLLWSFAKPDLAALAKLTAKARTDVESQPAV